MVDVRANPKYESSSPFGVEENYKEFLCTEEYKGKECGFRVRAKTDDEVVELAHMHQEMAHRVKDISLIWKRKSRQTLDPPPIRPGDSRVVRKSSLLDTCYTSSSGMKWRLDNHFFRGKKGLGEFQADLILFAEIY